METQFSLSLNTYRLGQCCWNNSLQSFPFCWLVPFLLLSLHEFTKIFVRINNVQIKIKPEHCSNSHWAFKWKILIRFLCNKLMNFVLYTQKRSNFYKKERFFLIKHNLLKLYILLYNLVIWESNEKIIIYHLCVLFSSFCFKEYFKDKTFSIFWNAFFIVMQKKIKNNLIYWPTIRNF